MILKMVLMAWGNQNSDKMKCCVNTNLCLLWVIKIQMIPISLNLLIRTNHAMASTLQQTMSQYIRKTKCLCSSAAKNIQMKLFIEGAWSVRHGIWKTTPSSNPNQFILMICAQCSMLEALLTDKAKSLVTFECVSL